MTFLLFIGEFFRSVKRNWRAWAIFLGIVALLIASIWIRACYVGYKQEQVTTDLNEANTQIFQANTNSGIIESERDTRRQEVKDAEGKSKRAAADVNRVRGIDSANADTDARAVKKRFCAEFPDDSICH
jgi:hypothetical protein